MRKTLKWDDGQNLERDGSHLSGRQDIGVRCLGLFFWRVQRGVHCEGAVSNRLGDISRAAGDNLIPLPDGASRDPKRFRRLRDRAKMRNYNGFSHAT